MPVEPRWRRDTSRCELDDLFIRPAKQDELPGREFLIHSKFATGRNRRRRVDLGEPAITIEKKLIMTQLAFVEFGNCYPSKTGAEIFGFLDPFFGLSPLHIVINQS